VASSSSRLHALRPYLWGAVVPAALALLLMGPRLGGLLAVGVAMLVLTVGVAVTSPRAEGAPDDPRGRLYGRGR
jgi:hypothetical protein